MRRTSRGAAQSNGDACAFDKTRTLTRHSNDDCSRRRSTADGREQRARDADDAQYIMEIAAMPSAERMSRVATAMVRDPHSNRQEAA
jgi:hypothetical protein